MVSVAARRYSSTHVAHYSTSSSSSSSVQSRIVRYVPVCMDLVQRQLEPLHRIDPKHATYKPPYKSMQTSSVELAGRETAFTSCCYSRQCKVASNRYSPKNSGGRPAPYRAKTHSQEQGHSVVCYLVQQVYNKAHVERIYVGITAVQLLKSGLEQSTWCGLSVSA